MPQDVRELVVRASRALAAAGLGDMVWGHVSVRDPRDRGAWLKAAGWGFEEVERDRVVLVSPDGEVLDGTGRRHLEHPIHTGIMALRPDVHAVVHTHAPALAAFASLGRELKPVSHDAVPVHLPAAPAVPRNRRARRHTARNYRQFGRGGRSGPTICPWRA